MLGNITIRTIALNASVHVWPGKNGKGASLQKKLKEKKGALPKEQFKLAQVKASDGMSMILIESVTGGSWCDMDSVDSEYMVVEASCAVSLISRMMMKGGNGMNEG